MEITADMLTSPLEEKSFFVTHQLCSFEYDNNLKHKLKDRKKIFVKPDYLPDILNKVVSTIFNME